MEKHQNLFNELHKSYCCIDIYSSNGTSVAVVGHYIAQWANSKIEHVMSNEHAPIVPSSVISRETFSTLNLNI